MQRDVCLLHMSQLCCSKGLEHRYFALGSGVFACLVNLSKSQLVWLHLPKQELSFTSDRPSYCEIRLLEIMNNNPVEVKVMLFQHQAPFLSAIASYQSSHAGTWSARFGFLSWIVSAGLLGAMLAMICMECALNIMVKIASCFALEIKKAKRDLIFSQRVFLPTVAQISTFRHNSHLFLSLPGREKL